MFKRLKRLEDWKENIVTCEKCKCLLKEYYAFKVKKYSRNYLCGYYIEEADIRIETLYFCKKCKPNYDEINGNGDKIKNKKVIVK